MRIISIVFFLLQSFVAVAQQDMSSTSDNIVSMTMFMDADMPWYRSVWFCVTLALLVVALIVFAVVLYKKYVKLRRELSDISHPKELNDANAEPVQTASNIIEHASVVTDGDDTSSELAPADGGQKTYVRKSARVVVVASDEHLRNNVVRVLESCFHVKDFDDGETALLHIKKTKPDAVISDEIVQQMDGMTLCKKMRRNVDTNIIPVILLASDDRDNNRIKALDVGVDAYIVKPVNISVLTHTITNLVKRNLTLKNSYLGRQANPKDVEEVVSTEESPDQKLMARVLKVINENMSNPDLTVEEIAKSVGISRVHLHRKLKGLTNQSTIDFLRNVRLDRASKLLRIKHNNVSEVAQEVGFVSTAYFSTVFKERFGCPPSAYWTDFNAGSAPQTEDGDEGELAALS